MNFLQALTRLYKCNYNVDLIRKVDLNLFNNGQILKKSIISSARCISLQASTSYPIKRYKIWLLDIIEFYEDVRKVFFIRRRNKIEK